MTVKHILLPLTGEANSAGVAVCALTLAKQLVGGQRIPFGILPYPC